MHVTDWAAALKADPELDAVLQWLESKKKTNLRTLLGEHASSEEGPDGMEKLSKFHYPLGHPLPVLYPKKGENEHLLLFIVSKMHQTATLNGCHQDAGHKGCDHTLSLLQECFWWPGMAKQMRQVIKACKCCLQYEVAPSRPIYALLWLLLH